MKNFLLITGASSGIGRQCAVELSKQYNLVLCGRNRTELEKTKQQCSDNTLHYILELDLLDCSCLEQKINNYLIEHEICIEKFLHCAGCLALLPAKNLILDECYHVFNVNLFSAMMIIKALLRKHNKQQLDTIVFISAYTSIRGVKGNSIYSASKAAIDSYMRCLAKELAPKVRVNSILPGAIDTHFRDCMTEEQKLVFRNLSPLGDGTVEDIAYMAEFLFSEKAKWITGQQFSVDGGISI